MEAIKAVFASEEVYKYVHISDYLPKMLRSCELRRSDIKYENKEHTIVPSGHSGTNK